MPLTLSEDQARQVEQLDLELRLGAEAIGASLAPRIAELTPALAPADGGEPEALLAELDLDHEGAPDALSLVACIAAHRGYVTGRRRPSGVSAGGLAIARLLVWAHRAALLRVCLAALLFAVLFSAFSPAARRVRYLDPVFPLLAVVAGLGLARLGRCGVSAPAAALVAGGVSLWTKARSTSSSPPTAFRRVRTSRTATV